ncbi:calcium-binding protein [Falsiroseomonas oryzae]|uniref:calcium-binding protein n=1 Tax=Falsiroseomonas oryzae TaxID=2766473 RepID=UPI0022EB482D|nr:calcium-binding protein [Roseomonas sp. MO-31]
MTLIVAGGNLSGLAAGGSGAETLLGAAGADTNPGANNIADADSLSGGGGNDVIFGGTGRDSLFGNAGDDTVSGGNEDDAISRGTGGDSLVGGDGIDLLTYRSDGTGVSVNLGLGTASGGHAQGDSISGFEALFGGSGNDTLIGDGGANALEQLSIGTQTGPWIGVRKAPSVSTARPRARSARTSVGA